MRRHPWLLLANAMLACEGPAAPAPAPSDSYVPLAPTPERPRLSSAAPGPQPTPSAGELSMLAPSLGVPHEVETELGAARAHLLEEWPTPRGGLPRLLLDRVELYPSGVDPGDCTEHASAMSARTNLPLVVLRGLGGVELEWERDFALGDDVEVCVAKPDGLACHAAPLPRHQVVLSIGPDRVGGRIRFTAGTERINARFSAVLCPVRSPPP